MRRPPGHRERLPAGMARHAHATLPRARATGFTPRPDVEAAPAGGTRAQAPRRHDHRNTRHGAGRGLGGATARMAQPVARHARGTHLRQGRARGPPRRRTGMVVDAPAPATLLPQWLESLLRWGPCSRSSIPRSYPCPVPCTTNRLEGGINAPIKRMLVNHRGLPGRHRVLACEWACYMKSAKPDPYRFAMPDGTTPPAHAETDGTFDGRAPRNPAPQSNGPTCNARLQHLNEKSKAITLVPICQQFSTQPQERNDMSWELG